MEHSAEPSMKKNYLYNVAIKGLNIIFPLITFPYVSRILLPEGIGKFNFCTSLIAYFILISRAGLPTYALRECSKVRDKRDQLSQIVQELLLINLVMLLVAYGFLWIAMQTGEFDIYKQLIAITSINILATSLGVEWFYQAIENYRYITIRNVIVRIISLVLIFIFVKDQNDVAVYALITFGAGLVGNIYNFVHMNKYCNLFQISKGYRIKQHLKPMMTLFAMSLSVSIYLNLDKIMLGFIHGDTEVGLYATANTIVKISLSMVTALGTVVLARMSYYEENQNEEAMQRLIAKSFDVFSMLSIPIVVGLISIADSVILAIGGVEYIDSISTLRLLSPVIIIIGFSNLTGIQVLVAKGKEKYALLAAVVGAITNIALNTIFIPLYRQNGAVIGTLGAELIIACIHGYFAYPYMKGIQAKQNVKQYLIGGLCIVLVCRSVYMIFAGTALRLILSILFSVLIYFGILYKMRNEQVYTIGNTILKKLKH